jgi:CheY-like chemotaxis protein
MLRSERVDLRETAQSAIEALGPFLAEHDTRLTVDLAGEPLDVIGDAARLQQVQANLLSNAAKYSPRGSQVHFELRRAGNEAVIRVTDHGQGIEPEMLPRIFDLFTQVESTSDRTRGGGLGIGLTLVRSLVELHGGSVQAWSEGPDKGSEFVVRLPLAAAQVNPVDQHTKPEAVMRRRILVVDDNPDSAESLRLLLELLGADVRAVLDGFAALAALDTYHPDVVLLDIGMPGMDGYQLAREARRRPVGRHVTLIALTGWGQEEDRRRSLEAGIDYHLVKPVDIAALERLLATLPERRRTAS